MRFKVQLVIRNEYGEFRGEKVTCNIEQYSNIINMSKSFYSGGGFEMLLEDDSFVVFPPDIIKRSILVVEKEELK